MKLLEEELRRAELPNAQYLKSPKVVAQVAKSIS